MAFVKTNLKNKVNDRKWRGLCSDGTTEIEIRYTGRIDNLNFDTVFCSN